MKIEINPKSLQNLETICEILYKLHPSVLNDLVDMERKLGKILGVIDENNISLEKRELMIDNITDSFTIEGGEDEDYNFKKILTYYMVMEIILKILLFLIDY